MTWIRRLRTDFRLALLTLFSATAVVGITPFAVYRFIEGEPLAGLVDVLAMLGISAAAGYAWRSGNLDRAGLVLSVTCSAACIAVATLVGLAGALWMYPVLLGNFLLISRGRAVLVSILGAAVMAFSNPVLAEDPLRAMFLVTAVVVCLFAYIFAARTELQRQQLEAAAVRDPLTGAYNRRGFSQELEVAIAAGARDGTTLGLAVLDLDHFKQVNDAFGHDAGDAVLVRFAEVVRRATRKGDRFFRLGGEEFALLLPGADVDALRHIGEQLRAAVAGGVRCGDKPVTVSIGATALEAGEAASDWLRRADAAMYRAKREGRNRVVVEEPGATRGAAPHPAARHSDPHGSGVAAPD